MNFSQANRTIDEPYIGNSFQLPPAAFPKTSFQQTANSNTAIDRDDLNP